jgi:hypothetical protein
MRTSEDFFCDCGKKVTKDGRECEVSLIGCIKTCRHRLAKQKAELEAQWKTAATIK